MGEDESMTSLLKPASIFTTLDATEPRVPLPTTRESGSPRRGRVCTRTAATGLDLVLAGMGTARLGALRCLRAGKPNGALVPPQSRVRGSGRREAGDHLGAQGG